MLPTHPTQFHINRMHPDIEELLELVAARLTVEEVLDILGWEFHDLLNALKDNINDNYPDFLAASRD